MTINQALEILCRVGDVHSARVITDNMPHLTRFGVWRAARALRRGVPVAKIIHQKWFYGLKFYTNKYTLDPRPDTETLVESVISDTLTTPNILDIGTGTACIISALVKNVRGAHGVGMDVSRGAVRVARRNIKNLGIDDKVKIIRASFNNPRAVTGRFDIIVSNPPYIAHGDPRVDAGARHDPRIALYASHNGNAAYEQIAQNACEWIKPGGRIYLEIGRGAMRNVRKIFRDAGWTFVRADRDLGHIVRVLVFKVSTK